MADGQQSLLAPHVLTPTERWRVELADAVEGMASLPPESVDLIITDPAYESLEKHRAKGTTTRLKQSKASSNEWFPIFPNVRFGDFFAEAYCVLKPNTHLYVLCDQETMFHIKPIGEAAGFRFWKPLIWDKGRIGMGYHFRARYELILFFEKGKRKLADLGMADVFNVSTVRNGYPTEKPVDLLRPLVTQSSSAGDLVLDPFCGSGSTGDAALTEGRRFLGFDVAEKACETASSRLLPMGRAMAANPKT